MHDPDTIPLNFTLNQSSQYANKLPSVYIPEIFV
jgi:hypothetical protein